MGHYHYTYRPKDFGELDEPYEFKSIWHVDDPDHIAEAAAEDYHSNHSGWEDTWPIDFEIFSEGRSLGVFTVEREMVPEFLAFKKD